MCGHSRATSPRATPTGSWSQPRRASSRSLPEPPTMPARDGSFSRRLALGRLALRRLATAAGAVVLFATQVDVAHAGDLERLKLIDSQIEPVSWTELDGWTTDDHAAAFSAFRTSCGAIIHQRAREDRPMLAALKGACRQAMMAGAVKADKARAFFENNFRAVRIAKLGEKSGLLTGYYEPVVEGSRFPSPEFSVPLYRRPRDLLVAGQKLSAGVFPNRAVVNRLNDKQELEPYYDRLAIENGALDGQGLEICWIRDAFDAMSIQIQGSARVILEDGTTLRINYDAHNGHGYTAVGRILIERGLVPREEMSMDRIRRWMHEHPD